MGYYNKGFCEDKFWNKLHSAIIRENLRKRFDGRSKQFDDAFFASIVI